MGRPLLRDEVPVGLCKVRALFSWSGETPQDLGFVEGDIIEVLNTGDGDWWTGKLKRNKLVGVFPRNFAEYVDNDQETMSAALTEKKKKRLLTDYTLESGGEAVDFSSFSLADLQIPDPRAELDSLEPLTGITASTQHVPTSPDPNAHSQSSQRSQHSQHSHHGQSNSQSKSLNASQNSKSSYSHLQPHSQLGASGSSNRSSKSAKEILDDITKEFNGGFLDDVNLDVKPEELRTPELCGEGFEQPDETGASHVLDTNKDDIETENVQEDEEVDNGEAPPAPPPHKVSVNSRKSQHSRSTSLVPESAPSPKDQPKASTAKVSSSALTGPVIHTGLKPALGVGNGIHRDSDTMSSPIPPAQEPESYNNIDRPDNLADLDQIPARSPDLDQEIPFDPKALTAENSIGDHIGSHIDTSAFKSTLAAENSPGSASKTENSVIVPKTRSSKKAGNQATETSSNTSKPTTVFYPQDQDSKKPNFFQKLFPKNSQTFLRRSFSRSSHKSSKSSKSVKSVTSKLRNMKSKISLAFTPDDSLYPTNTLSKTRDAPKPAVDDSLSSIPAPPEIKRISTPPRANLNGLGLASPLSRSPQRSKHTDSADFGGGILDGTASKGLTGGNKEPIAGRWMESRQNLYRAKTLTERDVLKRRQELELQGINSDNLVESLNHQNLLDFHDYRLEDFEDVDQAVRTMSTWPQLMTPSVFASSRIGRHFRDPVERVRAVFLLCATRIQHVTQSPPGNNVMQSRQATPKELANTVVSMCSALDIECVAVDGHRRIAAPGSKSIKSVPHTWNAVNINGEWRLIDTVAAASNASGDNGIMEIEEDDDDDVVNLYYFLTPPSQLIYSHVPNDHHSQFCSPALPTATVALLPLASPAAFAHGIFFDEFWLGMTRLADLEVAELSLSVPDASKDIVGLIDGHQQALAQAYWSDSDHGRHFRIKGFVPPHLKQASLQIYVVPKSQASRNPEDMELMWTVELRHVSGGKNNSPYEFVGRYAVPSVKQYDLYVLEPQCRSLSGGDTYTFKIENFDARGGKVSRDSRMKQPKVAIQSPSGRLTRLVPFGTDVHDTFRATVKTLEVGTWRSVVRADESDNWVPFAEWFCS